MAEPDQPKKETVRIHLPVPLPTKPPEPGVKPHETVRIQLPVREPGIPPVPSPSQSAPENTPSMNFFSPPKPPAASRPLSASASPLPVPSPAVPQKETVRIPLTEPLRSSQKKTQPLIAMPNVVPQNPPIAVAPVEKSSMRLYWMLLAISALILIIQIWTYFS
jgi:hypothetical protein